MKGKQPKHAQAIRRREILQGLSAWPVAAGLAALSASAGAQAALRVDTKARIVILGCGAGGLAVASRLHKMLKGASITIVDAKEEHNYQPGYTLVATGVWNVSKVRNRNAEFLPSDVHWVKEMAVAVDPVYEM